MAVGGVSRKMEDTNSVTDRSPHHRNVRQSTFSNIGLQKWSDVRTWFNCNYTASVCDLGQQYRLDTNICAYIDTNIVVTHKGACQCLEIRLKSVLQ